MDPGELDHGDLPWPDEAIHPDELGEHVGATPERIAALSYAMGTMSIDTPKGGRAYDVLNEWREELDPGGDLEREAVNEGALTR